MHEALGSVPSTAKVQKERGGGDTELSTIHPLVSQDHLHPVTGQSLREVEGGAVVSCGFLLLLVNDPNTAPRATNVAIWLPRGPAHLPSRSPEFTPMLLSRASGLVVLKMPHPHAKHE